MDGVGARLIDVHPPFTGRRIIYTDFTEIDDSNVMDVLERSLFYHAKNRAEIEYLYDYYRGFQPILKREKTYRTEICNRVVENRAYEIVSFWVGYLMGEPVQYVSRGTNDEATQESINTLNEFMFSEDKASKDKELAEWFSICGTAFRLILPDVRGFEDEAPFEIYTLDPRNTFVVYSSGLGHPPMMGVRYVMREDGSILYSVYTRNKYYEFLFGGGLTGEMPEAMKRLRAEDHIYGDIPIIEYPANHARLGSFEVVLGLIDALNTLGSNRVDGVEQFIQSLFVLKGVDIDDEGFKNMKKLGGLCIPENASAEILASELNQTQTQELVDYIYRTILTICCMPNRNGGSSTSDTGVATIFRDGWASAEARAKDLELMYKLSEKKFLRLAVEMTNTLRNMSLRLGQIDIRFTRRNYEHIQAKAQVLTTMLANDKIHPKLAFEHCGLFVDPDLAYTISEEYYEERQEEEQNELNRMAAVATQNARQNAQPSANARQNAQPSANAQQNAQPQNGNEE